MTKPRVSVTVAGNNVTATDGRVTRKAICANKGAATRLSSRLKSDPAMAARWIRATDPVQLDLPLPIAPEVRVDAERE